MGKSRETPKKYVTIPRLKLVAVVLSMKKAALIRRELDNGRMRPLGQTVRWYWAT